MRNIFEPTSLEEARAIILTPEGVSTDVRWERETAYTMGLLGPLNISDESAVLDFGCGIGRLSKALIKQHRCFVTGVDTSLNMRALALEYVDEPYHFTVASRVYKWSRFDAALAVWALQHTTHPVIKICRLKAALQLGGKLFVMNSARRLVPVPSGWEDDGISVPLLLEDAFGPPIANGDLDPAACGPAVAGDSWWAIYRKR